MMAAAAALQEQTKANAGGGEGGGVAAATRHSSLAPGDAPLVKIDADDAGEPIPLRNPSNNSVM